MLNLKSYVNQVAQTPAKSSKKPEKDSQVAERCEPFQVPAVATYSSTDKVQKSGAARFKKDSQSYLNKEVNTLQPSSKKIKKPTVYPKEGEYELQDISYPRLITDPRIHKKYQLRVKWRDVRNNKIRAKTVKFSDKNIPDYVDHENVNKKTVTVARMKNLDNPFKGSLYRLLLSNGPTTDIDQNYIHMLNGFGLSSKKQAA